MKGLRKRPTYDEIAEIVENNDDIIKKYPDRRAVTMRNHPYLTTLDGESFLNALNFTQDSMIRVQQRDLLVRQYATQTDDMSHLELRAKATRDATTNTQIRGREPMLETRDKGIGDNMVDTRDMGSSTDFNTRSFTSPVKSPSPERRNLVELFDMTVEDDIMKEEADHEIVQHFQFQNTKAGKKKMKIRSKFTDMLADIRAARSSVSAAAPTSPVAAPTSPVAAPTSAAAAADVIEDLDLTELLAMQVNKEGDQQKRQANTPPSSNKKKNKRNKAQSGLLEIRDNPEETHEPKGLAGRPKESAKSSSSSSAAAAPEDTTAVKGVKKTINKVKQVGVEKDTNTKKIYWKKQTVQYIYQQLELDGMRFTNLQKVGKEDVHDPILGKKVKTVGKRLTKPELLEMLYKSRNI